MPIKKSGKKKDHKSSLKRFQVSHHETDVIDFCDSDLHFSTESLHVVTGDSQFTWTGDFVEDFPRLCRHKGMEIIPLVVTRPRRPDCSNKPLYIGRTSQNLGIMKRNSVGRSKWRKVSMGVPTALHVDSSRSSLFLENTSSENQVGPHRQNTSLERGGSLHCFAPCVQIEYIQHRNQHTVDTENRQIKSLFVRGWRVDNLMMDVLKQCCVSMSHLSVLHLWNVGLTAETVGTLATFLPRCRALTTLVLDGNPLGQGDAHLGDLLTNSATIKNLSLRFCEVGDHNALSLSTALGTHLTWNQRLVTLSLSNNRITDLGARSLARGLMTNRTLLVLDLACNQIGDGGAAALAEVLSHFPLDAQQTKHRRWILASRETSFIAPELPAIKSSTTDLGREWKVKRKDATAFQEKRGRRGKEKDTPDKGARDRDSRKGSLKTADLSGSRDNAIASSRSRGVERGASISAGDSKKTQPPKMRMQRVSVVTHAPSSTPVDWHPLAERGQLGADGQFRLVGNRTLVSLNLSRNAIKEEGMRKLLEMVQMHYDRQNHPLTLYSQEYVSVQAFQQQHQAQQHHQHQHQQQQQSHHQHMQQQQLLQLLQLQLLQHQQQQQQQPILWEFPKPPPYTSFTGLKRLVLHKNLVSAENAVMKKIHHLMLVRDPLYRRPLLTLHRQNVFPCAMPPIAAI